MELRDPIVPTVEGHVKECLRLCGEPIVIFGESAAERRYRLMTCMTEKSLYSLDDVRAQLSVPSSLLTEQGGPGVARKYPLHGMAGVRTIPLLPVRTKATCSRASPALVEMRVKRLLPQTTHRAANRIRQLKSVFLTPMSAARQVHEMAIREVVRCVRLTKSVRNVKMESDTSPSHVPGGGGSSSVVGTWCMPFTVCAALPCLPPFVVTGTVDGLVTLWDAQICSPLSSLSSCRGNQWGRVRSLATHPERPYFFSSTMYDRQIMAWCVKSDDNEAASCGGYRLDRCDFQDAPASSAPEEQHVANINQLAVDPTGNLLASVSDDGTLRLWDVCTLCSYETLSLNGASTPGIRPLLTQDGYETVGRVIGVAFHPDGSLVSSADAGGRVVTWDTRTGRHAFSTGGPYGGHIGRATCVAWSPCGVRFASGGADHLIHLWDARMLYQQNSTDRLRDDACAPFMLLGHKDVVTSLSFLTNPAAGTGALGSVVPLALITTSLDHTVKLWDADNGLCVRSIDLRAPMYDHCKPATHGPRQVNIFVVGHSKYWSLLDVGREEDSAELLVHETDTIIREATQGKIAQLRGHMDAEDDEDEESDEDEMQALRNVTQPQKSTGVEHTAERSSDSTDEDEMALLRR